MEAKEMMELIPRPQMQRLKDLGMGIKIGKVMGTRVLIEPVVPFTDMDRVEKEGTLYLPEKVKDANTPPPTTGMVVSIGVELLKQWKDEEYFLVEKKIKQIPILKVGDMVLYSRFAGMDIVIDQGSYKLIDFSEIAAILEVDNKEATAFING